MSLSFSSRRSSARNGIGAVVAGDGAADGGGVVASGERVGRHFGVVLARMEAKGEAAAAGKTAVMVAAAGRRVDERGWGGDHPCNGDGSMTTPRRPGTPPR